MSKASTLKYDALQLSDEGEKKVSDTLILEVPLTIRLNGTPLTVTMQTPGHEKELTRGLLYTEGIFKHQSDTFAFSVTEINKQGHITAVDVNLHEMELSAISKRSLLSVAACGICGKTQLQWASGKLNDSVTVQNNTIHNMYKVMRQHQTSFEASGGCHAAAAFNAKGKMLCAMEDVGRHNAVDKVIGRLIMNDNLKQAKYLLVSGRVSYEIVAKTFAAGIPLLAAVSAPSSLAVDFAKELGIVLLGFCREGRYTRYA